MMNVLVRVKLLLLTFFSAYYCQSQVFDCITNDESTILEKDFTYCTSNSNLSNYKLLKTTSSPYSYVNSPIYTIKLKVHVIQYSQNDPRNYTITDIPQILSSINTVNTIFSNLQPPMINKNVGSDTLLVPLASIETDTRIRFSLNQSDIDFIQDTVGWVEYISNKTAIPNSYTILNDSTIRINNWTNTSFNYNCIEITNSLNNNGIYSIKTSSVLNNNVTVTFKTFLNNVTDNSGLIKGISNDNSSNRFYSFNKYHKDDSSAIHIYFVRNNSECYQNGFGEAKGIPAYALRMVNPMGTLPWINSELLAHELGHCLGLSHTWLTSSIIINDIFNPDNNLLALPCNTTSISNNIMGYNSCRNFLSPLQIAYVRRELNVDPLIMKTVLESTQSNSNNVIIINSNVVWDSREIIGGSLTIETGATLTVKCRVHFSPQGKVIIKPGGKLVIDGGELTSVFGQMWQGIEVWGTTSQHQYPLTQPTYQGKLELKNGGTIENAIDGARNWKPNDYSKIGGVIISSGGVFKNNKRAVEFVQYENFSQTNSSIKTNNLSSFSNTEFIIDNDYRDNPNYFQNHISMWAVYGISFTNCHFFNNVTQKTYVADRNRAIYSIDAGYTINAGCSILVPTGGACSEANLLKSSFYGFYKAIEATGAGTTKTVVVNQALFDKNVNGAYFTELDNFSVNRSIITLGNPGYLTAPSIYYGILTSNTTGYQIEENQFAKYSGTNGTYGVSISNSGIENNRVYKNKFTELAYGLNLVGINRNSTDALKGFQFLCNDFNGNTSRAVNILLNNSTNGIRLYQGEYSPFKSAGNTFLNTPTGAYTIYNGTPNGTIYYHSNGNTIPTYNSSNVYLSATTNGNTCPTSFGSSALMQQSLQLKSDSLKAVYFPLANNYLSLIDNGNTAEFIQNIKNEWSDDAWKLRKELIEISPYVSAKSLIEIIKQNILTNETILEICLANPDVTKNEEFIEQLKNICELPDYMLDYIRNNDEKTTRTLIEAQMASISFEKSIIEDEILRKLLTSEHRSFNEIKTDYSNKIGPQQKIDLIELAIENENWSMADSILQDALNNEILKGDKYLFDNYSEYISFRLNLGDRKLSQLKVDEITFLENLAQIEGRVSGYARNILCFFYEICYESSNVEKNEKSFSVYNKPDKTINELFYNILIYPNPSENFTSLKWEILEQLKDCKYFIYNVNGIEVSQAEITNNKGEIIIDTRKMNNGMYLVSIVNNGMKKQEVKFVVNNK